MQTFPDIIVPMYYTFPEFTPFSQTFLNFIILLYYTSPLYLHPFICQINSANFSTSKDVTQMLN